MHKPLVTLERNNAGELFIGVTEFNDDGYGVRAYVLTHAGERVVDSVMERRYADMVRLMGNNVRTSLDEKDDGSCPHCGGYGGSGCLLDDCETR